MPQEAIVMRVGRPALLLSLTLAMPGCAAHTPPASVRRPLLEVRVCFSGPTACKGDRHRAEKYLTRFGKRVLHRYENSPGLVIDRRMVVVADLDAAGALQRIQTQQGSGDAVVDAAVEALVRSAGPFGVLPAGVPHVQVELGLTPLSPADGARGDSGVAE